MYRKENKGTTRVVMFPENTAICARPKRSEKVPLSEASYSSLVYLLVYDAQVSHLYYL